MATFRHNNNEGEVRPQDDECLVRRRSASVLEVKEHAQDRLRDELLKAQSVRPEVYFESTGPCSHVMSQCNCVIRESPSKPMKTQLRQQFRLCWMSMYAQM